jgi:hypothetical protein
MFSLVEVKKKTQYKQLHRVTSPNFVLLFRYLHACKTGAWDEEERKRLAKNKERALGTGTFQ